MPLQRRLPKRGFNSLARGLTAEVRLSDLQKMQLADIDLKALKEAGVVPEATEAVKVILSGKLERKAEPERACASPKAPGWQSRRPAAASRRWK